MKRIMAMLLTVVMVVSLGNVVWAAGPESIKDALKLYGEDPGVNVTGAALETALNRTEEVTTDVKVREAGTSAWFDGPISIGKSSISSAPKYDFVAIVDMEDVRKCFDAYVNVAKFAINLKGEDRTDALLADLEVIPVTGSFEITIDVPAALEIPKKFINAQPAEMYGFNDKTKELFYEKSRTVNGNKITIEIGVGGTKTAKKDVVTKTELDALLGGELTLTCEDVKVKEFGTHKVSGKFTGKTLIGDYDLMADDDHAVTVTYHSGFDKLADINKHPDEDAAEKIPWVSATVEIYETGSSSGSGGGGGGSTSSIVKVEFIADGKVIKTASGKAPFIIDLADVAPAAKDGLKFVGWYLDKELTERAPDPMKVTKNIKLYARWIADGDGPVLEATDHFAYVIGYTDDTVRPLNNILREEVAAIFFRLLTEKAGEAIHAEVAPYRDVPATKWSSTAIATLSKGGYITGRDDGTFAPEMYITRAEFATIAARFSGDVSGGGVKFSDINGHWAKKYIEVCAANGWINGYNDGTYKPDQNITRAEAMAIVNRMLGRAVDESGIAPVKDDVYRFKDNEKGAWYYYIVLEATNSHDYERGADDEYETWTKVTEVRDWKQYE